jgi:hypothetical protein
MSLWVDKNFLNILSARLDRFKWKSNTIANCRCPFCGDSQKNKYKARGYFFTKKSGMAFKCHNCEIGHSLGNVIKSLDPTLYQQYVMERYKSGEGHGKHAKPHAKVEYKGDAPVFAKKSLIDTLMDRVDKLPEDHMAVQFVRGRQIPKAAWSRLYHINDVQDLHQLSDGYKDRIIGNEPRLAIPFWHKNHNGEHMFALTCRSYEDEAKVRYLMLRIDENIPLIYGSETIDPKMPMYVVEGPIDSLFLDNCLAVAGSDFKKIRKLLSPESTTMILDNQPRNKDVINQMRGSANAGFKVFIWPDAVVAKDINEWVQAGATKELMMDNIEARSKTGAAAHLAINEWSKL